jgi:hypothetical protein
VNKSNKIAFWRNLLIGIAISGVALWLVLRSISWDAFARDLLSINPWTLALALVFYLVAMSVRALCWRTILQGKVSWPRAFFIMNEGYLLNNVFPLRVGELGRAVIMGRRSGLGFFQVLSSILVERAFDMANAAILLLSTLPLVLAMAWARSMAWTILGLVIAGMVGLYFMVRYREVLMQWAARVSQRFNFITQWLLPKINSVLEGFSILTKPGAFALSFALLFLSWGLAIVEEYIILRSLVPGATMWWLAFVLGVSALGAAVPSVGGSIGVYEAAAVGALILLGVDKNSALAFAIVVHAIQLGFSSLFGFIGLTQEGESLLSFYQSLTEKKPQTS